MKENSIEESGYQELAALNGIFYKGIKCFFDTPTIFNEPPLINTLQGDFYINFEQNIDFKGIYLLQSLDQSCSIRVKTISNDKKYQLQFKPKKLVMDILVFDVKELIEIIKNGRIKLLYL